MTDARFSTDGGRRADRVRRRATRPASVELVGPRARVDRDRSRAAARRGGLSLPLRASRWGGPELPLPTGEYELRIEPRGRRADERHRAAGIRRRSPSSARCAPRSTARR